MDRTAAHGWIESSSSSNDGDAAAPTANIPAAVYASVHATSRLLARFDKDTLQLVDIDSSDCTPIVSLPLTTPLIHGLVLATDPNDQDTITLLAVDRDNIAHAWRISDEGSDVGHSDVRLQSSSGAPLLVSGIFNGQQLEGIAVAYADGSLLQVECDGTTNRFTAQHHFKIPSSYAGIRSLFSRGGSSSTHARELQSQHSQNDPASSSSTSQILSLESTYSTNEAHTLPGYLFSVSRDRKLRAWSTLNNSVVETVQLPASPLTMEIVPASLPLSTSTGEDMGSYLPPTLRPLIRFVPISSMNDSPFLLVYIPTSQAQTSFFILYYLSVDDNGQLTGISSVSEIPCDFAISSSNPSDSRLVDFRVVSHHGCDTLWTLWSENGQAIMRSRRLQISSQAGDTSAMMMRQRSPSAGLQDADESIALHLADAPPEWVLVHSSASQEVAPLSVPSSCFDSLYEQITIQSAEGEPLEDLSIESQALLLRKHVRQAASTSFLSHIFQPGKFALGHIQQGLASYLSSTSRGEAPAALSLSDGPRIAQTILDLVASSLAIPTDPGTGAIDIHNYVKRYKTEWMKLVSLVEEKRRQGIMPLSLSNLDDGQVLTLTQGGCLITSRADGMCMLYGALSQGQLLSAASSQSRQAGGTQLFAAAHRLWTFAQSDSLEAIARQVVVNSFTDSILDVAAEAYETGLEQHIDDDLASDLSARLTSLARQSGLLSVFEQAYRDISTPLANNASTSDMDEDVARGRNSVLFSAFAVDMAAAGLQARYTLSLSLFALVLFVQGELLHPDPDISASQADAEPLITEDELATLLVLSFDSLRTFSIGSWLVTHNIAMTDLDVTPALEDAFGGDRSLLGQLENMRMGHEGAAGQSLQLVGGQSHSVLAALSPLPRYAFALDLALSSTATASSALLSALGFTSHQAGTCSSNSIRDLALIAVDLHSLGLLSEARSLLAMIPDRAEDAGLLHLDGVISAEKGEYEQAKVNFNSVAGAIFTDDASLSTLKNILNSADCGTRSAYYRFVISIFDAQQADRQVADLCKLAILAQAEEAEAGEPGDGHDTELWLREVWYKAFRALTKIEEFDEAYNTMMAMPYKSTQEDCLRHLVATTSEGGYIDILLGYSFIGLHAALEQTLSFRAKNSHPLSFPDYHKILFAWHTSRSDYRSAAAIMYQRARRLLSVVNEAAAIDALTGAAQSYLAATSTLALVETDKQFILVEGNQTQQPRRKRQRMMDAPVPDATMVTLNMMRKDYVLVLSRLQLGQDFPELQRPNQHLDAVTAVALFSQIGSFDAALQVALSLDVDMSNVFERIALRCVDLSHRSTSTVMSTYDTYAGEPGSEDGWLVRDPTASNWEGSLASKGWRLLEVYLGRYDTTGTYRKRVLSMILREDRGIRLPRWLVEWMMAHHPEYLIWRLVEYDLLEEAYGHATSMVEASTRTLKRLAVETPGRKQPCVTYLPYNLFDQLMVVDLEEETAKRRDIILELQKELRNAIAEQHRRLSGGVVA